MRFAFIFIAFGSFFHNARAQQHSDLDSAYYICQKQLYHMVSNMTAARGFSLSLSGSARLACEE